MIYQPSDQIQQETKKFREGFEAKKGNVRQPIHDNITPENIYCSTIGDDDDVNGSLFRIGWNNRCYDTWDK